MLVRLIIRFSKEERVKYISHLDLMRTLQRTLRRAEIPVAFSQGFNPHPRLAFASALAVGMTSEGEYIDILLEQDMEPREFCDRLNAVLPLGIRMLEGIKVSNKAPSLMSVIERADYLIKIPNLDTRFYTDDKLAEFLSQDEIIVEKKGKKGLRNINIRELIHHLEWIKDKKDSVLLKTTISTGSKRNLKPDILVRAFLDWLGVSISHGGSFRIHRLDMYIPQGSRWITPLEIE